MQPQDPYGRPQQPYAPTGANVPPGGQPVPPGPAYPGQPYYGSGPGQTIQPNPAAGQPGPAPAPGNVPTPMPGSVPVPGQPAAIHPQLPGQPPVPAYELPNHLRQTGAQADSMLPPPPDAPTTPYDFFMAQPKPAPPVNPLSPRGKRMVGSNGNAPYGATSASGPNKMFLLIGGAVAVLVILGSILAFSPKDTTGPQLFGIAQSQQEIIRVCNDGASKAKLRAVRNFAVTCYASVSTNQSELLGYMRQQGLEFNAKQINGKVNGQTDAKLKSAGTSSNYDGTFREIIKNQLAAYDRSLTAQLAATEGVNGRTILDKSQKANDLLIQMISDESDKTAAPVTP